MKEACQQKIVIVSESTVQCPGEDESIWNAHPVIFLTVAPGETVTCPYCSTIYKRENDV